MHDMVIESERTLCFLRRDNEILLSRKLPGPGALGSGKWNGYGGKIDPGEQERVAVLREFTEESTATANESDLEKRAVIDFYFPHEPKHNQRVHIYFLYTWKGTPSRTKEMDEPKWFEMDKVKLPYDQMWAGDAEWLPYLMDNKKIKAKFVWTRDRKVAERVIDIVDSFD